MHVKDHLRQTVDPLDELRGDRAIWEALVALNEGCDLGAQSLSLDLLLHGIREIRGQHVLPMLNPELDRKRILNHLHERPRNLPWLGPGAIRRELGNSSS